MDKMLKMIAEMNNEEQTKVLNELEKKLGKEVADVLRERVFFIKLYSNEEFYKATVESLGNNLYNTLRG